MCGIMNRRALTGPLLGTAPQRDSHTAIGCAWCMLSERRVALERDQEEYLRSAKRLINATALLLHRDFVAGTVLKDLRHDRMRLDDVLRDPVGMKAFALSAQRPCAYTICYEWRPLRARLEGPS